MLSQGEGGGAGWGGDFDILSKIFVKNHSPGQRILSKNTKIPGHPRAGELYQMFLPRGNAIHSRHPPRPNQTKKVYVAKSRAFILVHTHLEIESHIFNQ